MKKLTLILLIILISLSGMDRPISLKLKLKFLREVGFRFPTGDSVGTGYYIAQKFQDPRMYEGTHLGIDVSGIGKYNSDFGDTIYSINNGYVCDVAYNKKEYLSIYYKKDTKILKAIFLHCSKIFPSNGDYVKVGEPIALIGNSDGLYAAHLHLEIASDTSLWFGAYGLPDGYIDPETILPHWSNKTKK